ncbi:MAG: hypothetical protein ACREV5_05435 [Steroidobacter sp.]
MRVLRRAAEGGHSPGSASIILGVMGVHGSPAKYTNLGGAQVSNLAPGPGFSGSVAPNGLDNVTGPFALPGIFIGNYTGGQNASIQWSVVQATRTLTVNVFPGGTSQSMTYPATNAQMTAPVRGIRADDGAGAGYRGLFHESGDIAPFVPLH